MYKGLYFGGGGGGGSRGQNINETTEKSIPNMKRIPNPKVIPENILVFVKKNNYTFDDVHYFTFILCLATDDSQIKSESNQLLQNP